MTAQWTICSGQVHRPRTRQIGIRLPTRMTQAADASKRNVDDSYSPIQNIPSSRTLTFPVQPHPLRCEAKVLRFEKGAAV